MQAMSQVRENMRGMKLETKGLCRPPSSLLRIYTCNTGSTNTTHTSELQSVETGAEGRADHNWCVVAIVSELCEQLTDLDLHQLQHLLVIYNVGFVDENNNVLDANLPRQQDVLSCLRHLAVGARHHQDAAVHLGCACNHVLRKKRRSSIMAENRQPKRYPQNLGGVLQLAVDAGSAAEGPSPIEPMSEERKLWLKGALAEVCKGQMDEKCLEVLKHERDVENERGEEERGEEDEDERESIFDILSELPNDSWRTGFEHLPVSVSFPKWTEVARCPSHRFLCPEHAAGADPLVQTRGAAEAAAADGLRPNPTVRVKALYAVSCLVREQEEGLKEFLSNDGYSVLMRGMQSDNEKLRTKSAFLLLNLLMAEPEQKDTVVSMGMVQQLVSVLRTPHSPVHEHVLGALCCLVEECPKGLKDCSTPALGLEELLKQRFKELKGKEESEEELEFCERLRGLCFHGPQADDIGMDR
ncbi:hypothetical protein F7725_003674 [Dissostichus mawsoni]|uniref:Uncharacterized protein n=1 Tax=Dissostichus mawsoni TaxID=36200 RepID=A0A7J5YAV1_DISMA|nr:hypothetical protein F7725_003674 [Dissostichus mawsoni]